MQSHVKVGEGGRLVIPAAVRKAMNLHTGDEVIIRIDAGEMRIFHQNTALKNIQKLASCQGKEKNHTDDFIAFRKQDTDE